MAFELDLQFRQFIDWSKRPEAFISSLKGRFEMAYKALMKKREKMYQNGYKREFEILRDALQEAMVKSGAPYSFDNSQVISNNPVVANALRSRDGLRN